MWRTVSGRRVSHLDLLGVKRWRASNRDCSSGLRFRITRYRTFWVQGMIAVDPLVVLLTNDDGIDATGLGVLTDAFSALDGTEVFVVAPDRERSTSSHGMSLARPVYVTPRGKNRFAIDGLPVDCVYVGMYGLLSKKPDIVVSGVNHGANLGSDVIFSGTVAAARQAALQGVHGIATSLASGTDFTKAAEATVRVALHVAKMSCPPRVLNLNFPGGDFDKIQFASLGKRNYPHVTSKRVAPLTGQQYYWLGGPAVEDGEVAGTDGWLIRHGVASATLLNVDQTDESGMRSEPSLSNIIKPVSKEL